MRSWMALAYTAQDDVMQAASFLSMRDDVTRAAAFEASAPDRRHRSRSPREADREIEILGRRPKRLVYGWWISSMFVRVGRMNPPRNRAPSWHKRISAIATHRTAAAQLARKKGGRDKACK